jgi:ABC-type transport system involved in multi-copper enzyme maturation permease subunit
MSPDPDARRAMDFRAVFVMAKKEFMDNLRNKWILGVSAIFIILVLIVSYFGAAQTGGDVGFQGLGATVAGMLTIVIILVPILGLMLGYGAIVGEKESGSLQLLLAMPITRLEIMFGKFLGLGAVMMFSILLGLGVSAVIIIAGGGTEGWAGFLVFVGGVILLSLAFLSVGLLISTVTKRRSTALGLSVFFWFFTALIFNIIIFGVFIATGGEFPTDFSSAQEFVFPDWMYGALMVNPTSNFELFTDAALALYAGIGTDVNVPSFVNAGTTFAMIFLWMEVPIILAFFLLRRQDL